MRFNPDCDGARAVRELFPRRYGPSEDGLADGLLAALRRLADRPRYFQGPEHFLNWVRQRGVWRDADEARRQRRHPCGPLPDDDLLAAGGGRDRWSPEDRAKVWECLGCMPAEQRQLLEWHYYDRVTDREAARRLYGPAADSKAWGLYVHRRRRRAEELLGELLIAEGVGG
jgi:DNA-directed RNA polymerase specialized sigma24 family protein